MNKTVYVCSGTCGAIITKEQYEQGLIQCGTKTCTRYEKPFEKKMQCSICGLVFTEDQAHSH